jgi:hypothetical protein
VPRPDDHRSAVVPRPDPQHPAVLRGATR